MDRVRQAGGSGGNVGVADGACARDRVAAAGPVTGAACFIVSAASYRSVGPSDVLTLGASNGRPFGPPSGHTRKGCQR